MSLVYEGTDIEEFIFGEGTSYGYSDYDEELDRVGVAECREDADIACYRIALEAEQNYNSIMMALAAQEIATLESTGTAMVYTEGALKDLGKSLKTHITNFWKKIQGVFKKAMDWISQFVLSNKAFVKRFESRKDLKTPTKEFKGYDFAKVYTKSDLPKDILEIVMGTYDAEHAEVKMDTDAAEKQVRKDIIEKLGGTTSGDSSDFASDLKKAFRNGKEEKSTIALTGGYGYKESLTFVKEGKKSKNTIKTAYEAVKYSVKSLMKVADSVVASQDKGSDGEANARAMSKGISVCIRMISQCQSAHLKAVQDSINQAKAIVVFFNANQPKKEEKTNESAFDFLSGVEFI